MERPEILTSVLCPPEIRQWIEDEAKREDRSLSRTIVHHLRRAMQQQKATVAAE